MGGDETWSYSNNAGPITLVVNSGNNDQNAAWVELPPNHETPSKVRCFYAASTRTIAPPIAHLNQPHAKRLHTPPIQTAARLVSKTVIRRKADPEFKSPPLRSNPRILLNHAGLRPLGAQPNVSSSSAWDRRNPPSRGVNWRADYRALPPA